jgi:hypothetical protein
MLLITDLHLSFGFADRVAGDPASRIPAFGEGVRAFVPLSIFKRFFIGSRGRRSFSPGMIGTS